MSEKNEQDSTRLHQQNNLIQNMKHRILKAVRKLNDPQATVIAALITSIVSLVASVILAVFTHQQSKTLEEFKTNQSTTLEAFKTNQLKTLEEFKANLVGFEKHKDELDIFRGSALKYIQALKETLDAINTDRALSFGTAKAFLGTAAYQLKQAYGDGLKSIVSKDPNQEQLRLRVHRAKNLGLGLLDDFNKTKQQDSELVPESLITNVTKVRNEINKIEDEILKDRVKPMPN